MEILPNMYRMDGLRGCNVYLRIADDGLTLIDTGVKKDAIPIAEQIEDLGFLITDLQRIFLTHSHIDHTGAAAELSRKSGAVVLAYEKEVPYIERKKTMPPTMATLRILNWVEKNVFTATACNVDQPLKNDELLNDLKVIHTPGHTPGCLSLYQPEQRILFCGDALFNMNPLTGKKGLRFPLKMVTVDYEQAYESVLRLSDLPIEILCCGHGDPILEGADEKIKILLDSSKI